jgi:hypothetical protein
MRPMFDQAESFVTPDGRTIGAVMMEMKNITLRLVGLWRSRIFLLMCVKEKSVRLSGRMALEIVDAQRYFWFLSSPGGGGLV